MIANPKLGPIPYYRVADTVFVGQAPGAGLVTIPCAPTMGKTEVAPIVSGALLGNSGERLAQLLEMTLPQFALFKRINLNAKYPGPAGKKGDAFDMAEGKAAAVALLLQPRNTHYVLLGAKVAAAFGFAFEPLKVHIHLRTEPKNQRTGRKFLILPHPSGIVLFWNEPFNVFRARRALHDFLAEDIQPYQPMKKPTNEAGGVS